MKRFDLLFGHDETVATWAASHAKGRFIPAIRALGVVPYGGGDLVGAATFHEFNGTNVELCYWGPWTLTPRTVRGIARFCFHELGVQRISCRTARNNRRIKEGLPGIGFKYEGIQRRFYGPLRRDDAIMYGLTLEDAAGLLGCARPSVNGDTP